MSIALATSLIAASPFAGSFAAAFVRNALAGRPALKLRFHCGDCGQRLSCADLVPLYSWIANSGTCGHCAAPIPLLYPAVELAFLAVAVLAALLAPAPLLLPAILLGWTAIVLSAFDILGFVLPDFLTHALGLGGLALAASSGRDAALESAVGLLAGGASLLLVKAVYRAVAGRDGLGLGDVKLFAAAGAWVGCEGLPQVLLLASLLGLGLAAIYSSGPKSNFMMKKIPFGAALCAALWTIWIWEPLSARTWFIGLI